MWNRTASEPPARHRRWPWILLLLVAVVVGTDQIYRWIGHVQVQRELARLRQDGYPVSEEELEQSLATIPDPDNAARKILDAADVLDIPRDFFSHPAWGRGETLDPAELQDLRICLTNNAEALQLVHAAARLKQSRFPIDYTRGPNALLPHLAKIKPLNQLLKAEALVCAYEGKMDQAVQAAVDSFSLARSLDAEPLLISQLVRLASLSISCSTVESLLSEHALSDAQLQRLTEIIASADQETAKAFPGGLVGEVCMGVYVFSRSAGEMANLLDQGQAADDRIKVSSPPTLLLYRWTGLQNHDFLFYLRTMHRLMNDAKLPFPEGLTRAKETGHQMEDVLRPVKLMPLSRMLLPALGNAVGKAAESSGRLRSAETALAVERFRLAHGGALPDQLAQLVPAFLANELSDPFDGAPLRFHKLPRGYVVYSIGPNGVDDGGLERTDGRRESRRRLATEKSTKNGPAKAPSRPARANNQDFDVTFIVER